ncbi:MAG: hypothetical protein WD557_06775 [Dehalococcoidia bacterium]
MNAASFALWFTHAWVRLYTRGLDARLRSERRAELESDIWEQSHGRRDGAAWAVLLRCLLGMPADLSWRLEQASPGPALTRL